MTRNEAPKKAGRQFSPEGTAVGSQGRKPLDRSIPKHQSPGGAGDSAEDQIGATTDSPSPRGCVWANLASFPLRVLYRPFGAWLLGRSCSRGFRPWLPTLAPPEPEELTHRDPSALGWRGCVRRSGGKLSTGVAPVGGGGVRGLTREE